MRLLSALAVGALCASSLSASVVTIVTEPTEGVFDYANTINNQTTEIKFGFLSPEAAPDIANVGAPVGWTASVSIGYWGTEPWYDGRVRNSGRLVPTSLGPLTILRYNWDRGQAISDARDALSAAESNETLKNREQRIAEAVRDNTQSDYVRTESIRQSLGSALSGAQDYLDVQEGRLARRQADLQALIDEETRIKDRLADPTISSGERGFLTSQLSRIPAKIADAEDLVSQSLSAVPVAQRHVQTLTSELADAEAAVIPAEAARDNARIASFAAQAAASSASILRGTAQADLAEAIASELTGIQAVSGFDYQSTYGPAAGPVQVFEHRVIFGSRSREHSVFEATQVASVAPPAVPLPASGLLGLAGFLALAGVKRVQGRRAT